MRLPRFRMKRMMLGVSVLAIFLGIDAQLRRYFDRPALSIDTFLLEAALFACSLPFTFPLALIIYLSWKENAHARWLKRDDTPAALPPGFPGSDWPSPK